MGLVLRLVETRADGGTRSIDVLELSRPGNLRDIADLGVTLPEASCDVSRHHFNLRNAASTAYSRTWMRSRAAS